LLGFHADKERCPKPDTIIFNSGLHDGINDRNDPSYFEPHLKELIGSWKKRYIELDEGNVYMIWKGNQGGDWADNKKDTVSLNVKAKRVMDYYGIPFVNISGVKSYVPRYDKHLDLPEGGPEIYTTDGNHFGSIARDQNPV
jgi:hypothetical protein